MTICVNKRKFEQFSNYGSATKHDLHKPSIVQIRLILLIFVMQSQNFQYEKHLIDKFNQQELIGLTFHPDSMGLFLFKVFDHTKGIS